MPNKFRLFLDDFHFYKDGKTSFIMLGAWAVSFIGILSLYQKTKNADFTDNTGLQSSYFIYSISFLADISLKLYSKKNIIVKMLYGIFFSLFFIVILICFASLSGMNMPDFIWSAILIFFISFLIILLIDTFAVYLIPPTFYYQYLEKNDSKIDLANKMKDKFEEALRGNKQ